jgi:hypothetical protein
MTISKALERVWEWKQAVYEETKDMTPQEQLAHFHDAQRRLEQKVGARLDLPHMRRAPRRNP